MPFTAFTYGDPMSNNAKLASVTYSLKADVQSASSSGPQPVAQNLQGGMIGSSYSETISAVGGTSPYTYSISAGSLPDGLSMSSAGVISGTPTTAGTSTFTVTVTDNTGATGTQQFSITVVAATTTSTPSNYGWFA